MLTGPVHGRCFQEYGRLLNDGQELLGLDVQGAGNADDGKELGVGFSVLDDGEIGDLHVDDGGEIRLRHVEIFSACGDGLTQGFEVLGIIVHTLFHDAKLHALCQRIAMEIHNRRIVEGNVQKEVEIVPMKK